MNISESPRAASTPPAEKPPLPTNFFSALAPFLGQLELTLTLRQITDERIAVSVLPKPLIADQVKEQIAPVVLTATASELDQGFFGCLAAPLARTQDFSQGLVAWEASQKKAEEENRRARQQKEAQQKQRDRADTHLKRGEELLQANKYSEAIKEGEKALVLAPAYEKVQKKLAEWREVSRIHAQASLFGSPPEQAATPVDEPTPFTDSSIS